LINPLSNIDEVVMDALGYNLSPNVHINVFVDSASLGPPDEFTFVLKGYSGLSIDTTATANDPLANAFEYVIQHFLNGQGSTSVTTTLDSNGNTVVTYKGPPILPSYHFDYGFQTNGKPHFGFQGMNGTTILDEYWGIHIEGLNGTEEMPTLSVSNPQVAGLDFLWAILFADVTFADPTCSDSGKAGGEWFEDKYAFGASPTWTLANPTKCIEALSDVGYFLSSTEIPLDDLNFGSEPPPGMPGSVFNPLMALDGIDLCPGCSITATAAVPEPESLFLLFTGFAGLLGFRWVRRAARMPSNGDGCS
jgi:hypothetical protein